jgi:DNA processing protein
VDLGHLGTWIKFKRLEGVGSVYSLRLLEKFGEPVNFLGKKLECDFLPKKVLDNIYNCQELHDWARITKLIEKFNIKYMTILDDDYPDVLRNIYSPPLILFYRGTFPFKELNNTLAVVGTRRADSYGKYMTNLLTRELSSKGVVIVSGLAYGIDTIAHTSCLNVGGKTIAVMATGCDQIYPPENKQLAERIIENGAIVSEYEPGIEAERYFFPQRNRIISALSVGTLVVQGKKNSGAMLTAKYALDQNKELFAVPGQVNNYLSEGPNYLIQNGATMVLKSQDIFSSFANGDYVEQLTIFPKLSQLEQKVYDYVKQVNKEVYFDEIVINTQLPLSKLSALLMNLELKGVVEALPGNKYIYLM